jgi:transposase
MVNLTNGHLVTQEAVTFNQETFQHFLEKALAETKGKLIILLDNARWHKSKRIQAFFLDHLDRLEPLYLPPYSPQCNPVERVWRLTRKLVTHNRYFETYYSLVRSLYDQWIAWGKPNRILHRLCANI